MKPTKVRSHNASSASTAYADIEQAFKTWHAIRSLRSLTNVDGILSLYSRVRANLLLMRSSEPCRELPRISLLNKFIPFTKLVAS